MPSYVALMRNIAFRTGRPNSAMLKGWIEKAGGSRARTVGATGNLVFVSHKAVGVSERELETLCAETFGAATEIIVKTGEAWRALLAANPFEAEARAAPSRLLLWAMRHPLPDEGLAQLQRRATGEETIVRLRSGDFYIWFGQGDIAASKLPAGFALGALGAVGTNRNWNTAGKIAQALEAMG